MATPVKVRTLIKTPVQTKAGYELGHLKDLEIDLDSLNVTSIIVTPINLAKKLLGAELVVPKDKVISIAKDLIVVDDSLAPAQGTRLATEKFSPKIAIDAGPAMTSKNEFNG